MVWEPNACQASESCTEPHCPEHRFDLYAALVGVADAWVDSLPQEPLNRRRDVEAAFHAVARLAAAEVFG